MRHWEDLLTRPALEVELALWVGAASEAYLEPNSVFPVGGGAGAASEAGLEPNNVYSVGGGAGAASEAGLEPNNVFPVRGGAGAAEVKPPNRGRPSSLA
jgi:hypothetical protein